MNYKQKTIAAYNKYAEEFWKKFSTSAITSNESFFGLFERIVPGKRILDAGCGNGRHAIVFKEHGFDVTCIDLSKNMISYAKKDGLNARIMDIENMTFRKSSFHGIWSVCSLLHVKKKNMKKVIRNFHAILKRDGVLFVSLKKGIGEGWKVDSIAHDTPRFFSYWTILEFARLAESHFELLSSSTMKKEKTTFINMMFKRKK